MEMNEWPMNVPLADTLLSWSCTVLVKDHVDLHTIARKEGGTEDVEIFL